MSLDVKLAASTWLWMSPFATENAPELFSTIKKLGYDAVELAIEDPKLIDAKKIKEYLSNYGLRATVCGAFGETRDLTNDDEGFRKVGLEYIEDCLEIASILEAGFFAGPMYSAVGKARLVSAEQKKREWERAVMGLQKASDMAQRRGLQLAVEPLNRFESDLINDVDDVLKLINDINHAAANVCLDMFHMNIEEPDPESAITKVGSKLTHMQVSENHRGTPGSGGANWGAYYRGLKKIGYRGVVSIESFTPENQELAAAVCIWKRFAASQDDFAKEGHDFLKKWINGDYK
ncbi:sugar phosphate isomerase/epimerase family protein [Albibacterium indicum]|uniref:sugar phosphate isomerase/epimerase family protein n=1 Tax=Albibacterium indicum TaxID=2292082 RepID=UPI000E4ABEDF|nr:sugar phosphate isomerase/epimerase [Pedobacter indicus]